MTVERATERTRDLISHSSAKATSSNHQSPLTSPMSGRASGRRPLAKVRLDGPVRTHYSHLNAPLCAVVVNGFSAPLNVQNDSIAPFTVSRAQSTISVLVKFVTQPAFRTSSFVR